MMSMLGVFIAQLFRLNHSPSPSPVFGFFVIGVPLSSICQVMALLLLLIGCHRFFKLQKIMALGKATSGGWEVNAAAFLGIAVCYPAPHPSKSS
jgi:hypothetical protein